jgi:hypothetical protein
LRSQTAQSALLSAFVVKNVIRLLGLPLRSHLTVNDNLLNVSKNVRARRCTRCPARLQTCCPGGELLLLITWAPADIRQVLFQQPHARHLSPILEGLLSRCRLARGAFESCCRSFVFVSFVWLRWCAYCAPARLADSASWIPCFATARWSVVILDPAKKEDENPLLLLVDTTIEGASPSHARH